MAEKIKKQPAVAPMTPIDGHIDCACLIHGTAYDWTYVDRLYSMLSRNFSWPIRLHVWTEAARPVPPHMIKHNIDEWPDVHGPRRAWWYKMQMFNSEIFSGRLTYFDLDVVVTGNLDWVLEIDPRFFWAIRDWKYLWRPHWQGINSSVMTWDTTKFHWVWEQFKQNQLDTIMRQYPGDQDFLSSTINERDRRFFNPGPIQSWRWEVFDGGLEFHTRRYRQPGAGPVLPPHTRLIVFHGRPKPHEITHELISRYWQ